MDAIITGIIIAVAAIYCVRSFLKKLKPGGGCGGTCSCGPKSGTHSGCCADLKDRLPMEGGREL